MKRVSKPERIATSLRNLLPLALLVFSLFLASCNSRPSASNNSSKDSGEKTNLTVIQNATLDSLVQFLLNASARDFYDHQPPSPVSFRNVSVRNLAGINGEDHIMLCGQFLARDKQDKNEWTSFATIKTSGYEQWIGNQSISFCSDSKAVLYKTNDLSSELKNRFDSLQKITK